MTHPTDNERKDLYFASSKSMPGALDYYTLGRGVITTAMPGHLRIGRRELGRSRYRAVRVVVPMSLPQNGISVNAIHQAVLLLADDEIGQLLGGN